MRVRFPTGKWQSVSRWGLRFGFRFRFGLLRGVGCLSGSGSGKVIALVCVSFASCLVVGSVCKGGNIILKK